MKGWNMICFAGSRRYGLWYSIEKSMMLREVESWVSSRLVSYRISQPCSLGCGGGGDGDAWPISRTPCQLFAFPPPFPLFLARHRRQVKSSSRQTHQLSSSSACSEGSHTASLPTTARDATTTGLTQHDHLDCPHDSITRASCYLIPRDTSTIQYPVYRTAKRVR